MKAALVAKATRKEPIMPVSRGRRVPEGMLKTELMPKPVEYAVALSVCGENSIVVTTKVK